MKILKNKIVYEKEINNLAGKANLIVYPESKEELKKVILTYKDIVPRGAGLSFVGGCLPKNSAVIDLSKMNKLIDIDSAKKTAYVEAGIVVKDLNDELGEYGLEFPIETLFSGIETIGGIAAKNSPGKMEIKYGRAMNWIESLEIFNSKGELIKIRKSDLGDYIGMEGITGLIVRATLRLINKKPKSISILKSGSLNVILDTSRKLRLEQETIAIDLVNQETSKLLGLENKYHLFVEFEGDKGNFKGKEYLKFSKLRAKAYYKISSEGFHYFENIKVSSDGFEDILIYLEQNRLPYLTNLASGVFYVFFKQGEKLKKEGFLEFAKKQRAKISYSMGYGLTKKQYLSREESEIMKRVKKRLDKENKFNNNKLVDLEFSNKSDKNHELEVQEQVQEEISEEIEEAQEIKEEFEEVNEEISEVEEEIQKEQDEREIREKTEKREPENQEEKDKIKKIAAGLFGGKND